jgi:hypothetical protein
MVAAMHSPVLSAELPAEDHFDKAEQRTEYEGDGENRESRHLVVSGS